LSLSASLKVYWASASVSHCWSSFVIG
jgi:hypothetical protein